MGKMRIYEVMICDGSKILVSLPIRTRFPLKEINKRLRLSIRKGDSIEGMESKDDLI